MVSPDTHGRLCSEFDAAIGHALGGTGIHCCGNFGANRRSEARECGSQRDSGNPIAKNHDPSLNLLFPDALVEDENFSVSILRIENNSQGFAYLAFDKSPGQRLRFL